LSSFDHYTATLISIEYHGETISDKRLRGYFKNVKELYTEAIMSLPFDSKKKNQVLKQILKTIQENTENNEALRSILIGLGENYPSHPADPERAAKYIRYLNKMSRYIAIDAQRTITNLSKIALFSDLPFVFFSDLVLGHSTFSYFNNYLATFTTEHFKKRMLLIQGHREKHRRIALEAYFDQIRPLKIEFKQLGLSYLRLLLYIAIRHSTSSKEVKQWPERILKEKLDEKIYNEFYAAYKLLLDAFRKQLFNENQELFSSSVDESDSTFATAVELTELIV
jgi:hypothetical protein